MWMYVVFVRRIVYATPFTFVKTLAGATEHNCRDVCLDRGAISQGHGNPLISINDTLSRSESISANMMHVGHYSN